MPLNIKFQRPSSVTITVEITLAPTTPAWSTDYETMIKQAIADQINGNQIGDNVLITKLYSPAYLNGAVEGTSYDIVSLEIGKNMDPVGSINIDLDFDEEAICDPDTDIDITVSA